MLDIDNVYVIIEKFYADMPAVEKIFKREYIERYMRRLAWQGHKDRELQEIWTVVSALLIYVTHEGLDSFAAIALDDYKVIINFCKEFMPGQSDNVKEKEIIAIIDDFYVFGERYTEYDYSGCIALLAAIKNELQHDEKFLAIKNFNDDEFYDSLSQMDELTPTAALQLNVVLNDILKRMDKYYRRKAFKHDIDKALLMYIGENKDIDPSDAEFWESFWEFFLFDYHLMENDQTPLKNFLTKNYNSLNHSERDIIKDLLSAKATVFSIIDTDGEYVACQNLFTDEIIELPMLEIFNEQVDLYNIILFGHIHESGVMLLNYIKALPASENLRQRIKSEILRQYALYKYQQPHASLDSFLARNAGAVRHTLRLMTSKPRLGIIPIRKLAQPITIDENICAPYRAMLNELVGDETKNFCSLYEWRLIEKMIFDYITLTKAELDEDEMVVLLAAVEIEFLNVNGINMLGAKDISEVLCDVPESLVKAYQQSLWQVLNLVDYDPRYLSEEGFIRALYYFDEVGL